MNFSLRLACTSPSMRLMNAAAVDIVRGCDSSIWLRSRLSALRVPRLVERSNCKFGLGRKLPDSMDFSIASALLPFAKGRAGRPLATHSQRRAVALALAAGAGASQAREAARRLAPLARSPLRACPCGTTIRASSSYCGTGRRAAPTEASTAARGRGRSYARVEVCRGRGRGRGRGRRRHRGIWRVKGEGEG